MVLAQRSRRTAVVLAWLGVIIPGLHKFYLGQPFWGCLYLLLWFTPISKVACAVEAVLLLTQSPEEFAQRWGKGPELAASATSGATSGPNRTASPQPAIDPVQIAALGAALRELDTLRQEGLISELEFEQKRRLLLDQVA